MKKVFVISGLIGLVLFGCKKEDDNPEPTNNNENTIQGFNGTYDNCLINTGAGDTKCKVVISGETNKVIEVSGTALDDFQISGMESDNKIVLDSCKTCVINEDLREGYFEFNTDNKLYGSLILEDNTTEGWEYVIYEE